MRISNGYTELGTAVSKLGYSRSIDILYIPFESLEKGLFQSTICIIS
jgi:hypothetical protein